MHFCVPSNNLVLYYPIPNSPPEPSPLSGGISIHSLVFRRITGKCPVDLSQQGSRICHPILRPLSMRTRNTVEARGNITDLTRHYSLRLTPGDSDLTIPIRGRLRSIHS